MKIVVIGGGAAGFFAAIHAANGSNEVIILEKSGKVLSKVRISGGGRCNVTNACDHPGELASFYPRGHRELPGPLSRFHTLHTRSWFESKGVRLKTEPDGRMFPVTDSSQTIIDCLLGESTAAGVKLKLHSPVNEIKKIGQQFEVHLVSGDVINADKVIIASGGGTHDGAYVKIGTLGHSIVPPVPSLFTFNIPDNPFKELMGVSVDPATVKINGTRMEQTGPLLFTHWGLSGPAVLRLSAWAAREIASRNYSMQIEVNFLPGLRPDACLEAIAEFARKHATRFVVKSPFEMLPARLWERLCELSGLAHPKKWGDASKTNITRLAQSTNGFVFQVRGKTTFREEFVTCGGVDLREVNMKTMESKKVPGLYFAGEVLDIDGVTGGFNFQAAWTTGYLAGMNAGSTVGSQQ